MIQANELRIGNRFIRELPCKRGQDFDSAFVLTEELMGKLFGDTTEIALQDLFPIPLTPEILEKCGFKKHNNAWVPLDYNEHDYNRWRFTIWNQHEDEYSYNSAEFPVHLQYLHQLMNLYYSLTGTELNYNP